LLHGSENSEKLVFMSEISENLKRETSSTPGSDLVYAAKSFPLLLIKWHNCHGQRRPSLAMLTANISSSNVLRHN